jgi:hypothetical protein
MARMMYCTAVRRRGDTFSSRPNIGCQAWSVRLGLQERAAELDSKLTLVLSGR